MRKHVEFSAWALPIWWKYVWKHVRTHVWTHACALKHVRTHVWKHAFGNKVFESL